jgi:protein ImuA
MNKKEKLAGLRRNMAQHGRTPAPGAISLGAGAMDTILGNGLGDGLGGGLRPGALHEIFAEDWGAGGFAACLAIAAARKAHHGKGAPLFWVRPDYEALEFGALHAAGFHELGGDPARLFLLRTTDAMAALGAAADILACPRMGALVLELAGDPKCLDLVASRRLALLAEQSGVTVFLLRENAAPRPSAAQTRWQVKSAAARKDDDDWGHACFQARLVRHRLGPLNDFTLQWDPEHAVFRQDDKTQDIGAVAGAPAHRPDEAQKRFA